MVSTICLVRLHESDSSLPLSWSWQNAMTSSFTKNRMFDVWSRCIWVAWARAYCIYFSPSKPPRSIRGAISAANEPASRVLARLNLELKPTRIKILECQPIRMQPIKMQSIRMQNNSSELVLNTTSMHKKASGQCSSTWIPARSWAGGRTSHETPLFHSARQEQFK